MMVIEVMTTITFITSFTSITLKYNDDENFKYM